MSNEVDIAKKNIFRQQYQHLMEEAEKETRRREDERRHELLSENPLDINYARWATEEEIKESLTPLFWGHDNEKSGIPLLVSDGITYVETSDSHSLIIGSSGSKKSRLFMMPSVLTLCQAGESMVITDPKAEIYEKTSGILKQKGYKVYCLNFRDDVRQNSWNPLEIPRQFFALGKFDLSVGLLNDFAHISVPHDTRNGIDPFWDNSARSAFMGMLLILMLLAENPNEVNIRSLLRLRQTMFRYRSSYKSQKSQEDYLSKLLERMDDESIARFYLSSIAIAPEKTFQSIMATLDTHLMKFLIRPEITDMLCHNDISFKELGESKVAIFVVMPDEKETYHGLVSLFIQQCYQSLIFEAQKNDNKTLRNRVNFLLDEFSSLPRIKEFPSMIAAARSRNIRFNIVVQSEKQLFSKYLEDAETIEGNCNNWIYLYTKEIDTLQKLSTLCGTQKSGKPLVTLSRLQRFSKEDGEALIFHGRNFPFLSNLCDIDKYMSEDKRDSYFEPPEIFETQLFKLEHILSEQPDELIRSKLTNNYGKKTENHSADGKKWAFVDKECNQVAMNSRSQFYEFAKKHLSVRLDGIDSIETLCRISHRVEKGVDVGKKVIVKDKTAGISVLRCIESNTDHIYIEQHDPSERKKYANVIAMYLLNMGIAIPILFDMSKLDDSWNEIVAQNKDSLTMLDVFIANDYLKESAFSDGDEYSKKLILLAKELMKESNSEINERPGFAFILYNLEDASNIVDSLWQAWNVAERKNVQLIVIGNNSDVVSHNCLEYSKKDSAITYNSPLRLYFDEVSNSVCAKQGQTPSIIFEFNI